MEIVGGVSKLVTPRYYHPRCSPNLAQISVQFPFAAIPLKSMPAAVVLNPASGSSNPATSSVALWAYLKPALDHIVRSPSNDPNGKAPAVDFVLYSGIHTACYN